MQIQTITLDMHKHRIKICLQCGKLRNVHYPSRRKAASKGATCHSGDLDPLGQDYVIIIKKVNAK